MIGVAIGLLFFGPLSDSFGDYRCACWRFAFIAFSFLNSLAWSIESMWIGRIFQGATGERRCDSTRHDPGHLRG